MKTLEEVLKDWEAVIGLEVHAELTTLNTKMFCGCKLEFGAEPNTHTCPVCLGLPGALPVPNKAAIESIVLAGLATNCDIEKHSMFYRKNYMYPDMSKNFQTTQGPVAFCMRGHLDLDVDGPGAKERIDLGGLEVGESRGNVTRTEDGYVAHVGITRIHMEEDAGKMVHIGGGEGRIAGATHSLVDYNRAGTPLIELVTEPELRTPEEARLFMQKLRQIYLAIGISDCSMEEGSLRCDGNVSLRRRGETKFGTKTELKNMNSFKNLHDGLAYEICRQAEVLEEGGIIYQETRHWDPSAKRTIVMRVKETADDYRLFPEPDLAPYDLSDEFIEGVRAKLPELPDQKAKRFEADFGLSAYDARHLVEHRVTSAFFEEGMKAAADVKLAKPLANLVINDITARMNADESFDLEASPLTPARAVELVKMTAEDVISSKQGKEVFAAILEEDKDPS
ncbi:Asp-tRNA(Asn)/Glu-tRNA(Gln) amidotransferase subunit GatB, partial [uncultured Slackia sp.]|uniref:Asp-tRNA(Asn)/Glu-tRNA(Gln) amidotransferase subunit GatB n=1 Tax=uncultured Slackia sp. TaxID=665903 RepID=UPI002634B9D3